MKSLVPLMADVRRQMGAKPLYISFDIDGLDPAYAPGTGTPEIAGLTPSQVRRFHPERLLRVTIPRTRVGLQGRDRVLQGARVGLSARWPLL